MENKFKIDKTFLETNQYTEEGIKSYEFIFGDNFISSGGLDATIKILSDIQLNENSKVLDIGSGLGGGCKYINDKYGAHVYGIDISENMVNIAKNRNSGNKKIEFEANDILLKDFPENTFDMIYSRDSILHLSLENKKKLFEKCYKWLKPNGIILVTDYCASKPENWDEEFKEYIKKRRYTLITVEEYKDLIVSCKFENVISKDISDMWLDLLEVEINKLEDKKEEFLKKFSQKEYNSLRDGWTRKIKDSKRKIQLWGYFKAVKL
ncbi:phosphoethanolamine N-methyltransferase, putative [Plasmodium gallinaceum]|uniref:phosphoethanolamine N-methyltransferase n=1 Tax=Plasmodium gallinaceum TaxID=5849 RepID=A0A1J1GV08_PLAGA|nr:phosphoethanolamine N-methyltransferase, putative [Plasmodium gallinaceum]CRG95136.1 phosphoethanolamine N-methyltransferase, putative [Plasmodium gallinaceum]